jgi:hypothetical protein
MSKLNKALQLDRISLNIADAIADQFSPDFCNDRMIEGFAEVVKNYINALRLEQETKDIALLDHFAGLAMQEFLALNNYKASLIATMSYAMADAMIAERKKRNE